MHTPTKDCAARLLSLAACSIKIASRSVGEEPPESHGTCTSQLMSLVYCYADMRVPDDVTNSDIAANRKITRIQSSKATTHFDQKALPIGSVYQCPPRPGPGTGGAWQHAKSFFK